MDDSTEQVLFKGPPMTHSEPTHSAPSQPCRSTVELIKNGMLGMKCLCWFTPNQHSLMCWCWLMKLAAREVTFPVEEQLALSGVVQKGYKVVRSLLCSDLSC